MPQGTYGSERRSPATFTAIALLHAGVAAAVLLTPGVIVHQNPNPPIHLTDYTDPPPPPPSQPPEPKRTTPRTRDTHIDTVPPLGPTLPDTGPTLPPAPPLPPMPPVTLGPVNPPTPPAPPAVLKQASMDPRYADAFQPAYPSRLMREGTEGRVTVRVLIGPDGRVKALEAVSATDPLFLETTRRQALARWRFLPATRDGVAVESWRTMTVRFEMQG